MTVWYTAHDETLFRYDLLGDNLNQNSRPRRYWNFSKGPGKYWNTNLFWVRTGGLQRSRLRNLPRWQRKLQNCEDLKEQYKNRPHMRSLIDTYFALFIRSDTEILISMLVSCTMPEICGKLCSIHPGIYWDCVSIVTIRTLWRDWHASCIRHIHVMSVFHGQIEELEKKYEEGQSLDNDQVCYGILLSSAVQRQVLSFPVYARWLNLINLLSE